MSWWSRVANVFRAGRVDGDLDAELQFHFEERVRALMAQGLTRDAASAAAARRFGNTLRWREQSRDVKLLPWLDSLLRDVRLGVRMMSKNAGVSGTALASLSLALGACLAAFSLVDALILRPLPVRNPERLVYLTFPTYSPERPEADTYNDPLFRQLRDASRAHVDLFAMSTQVLRPVRFPDAGGEKERVRTQYVSGDSFERLGVGLTSGRMIASSDDEQAGASPVAVISHAFWQRRFGGEPDVIGRWFTLGEQSETAVPMQIVGIAEPGFAGIEPGRPTDVWLPYAMFDRRAFGNYGYGWFRIFGRLRDGAGLEQAHSVLQTTFMNVRRDHMQDNAGPSPERIARFLQTPLYLRSAANGPSPLRAQFERSLWILTAIALSILLIAGSNIANLFLARTAAREREMALRLSIGASRGRLIQQMLAESAILAGTACVLGLLFAGIAAPAVVGMLTPSDDPLHLDLQLNWRLAGIASVITLLTTALFGLVPALRASGVKPIVALKIGGGRAGTRARIMRPFVALQVGFGLVVLFVGSLLVLSFGRLSSVDPGFATSSVLLISLDTDRRVEPGERRAALLQVVDRLRTIPGVVAASAAEFGMLGRAWTHNSPLPASPQETIEATVAPVTAGFFETMNIPIVAGRVFANDSEGANANTIVVNEAFAARFFGRGGAVGGIVKGRFGDPKSSGSQEVIGVVKDTRYDLRRPAAPIVYLPLPVRMNGTIQVRTSGDVVAVVPRLREEVRAANPLFRVTSIRPQSAIVDQSLLRERLLALLSGFFALVGLLLVAIGLYGVLSYSVVQRTQEIGVRVALGADQTRAIRTVLADASGALLVGVACGLAGGLYLSRFVEALLFEVKAYDVVSLALPLAALLLTVALAALLPALRAARVDPVIALRHE